MTSEPDAMPVPTTDLDDRLRAIRILLLDVDGVLTDGMVTWDNNGIEQKAFHIRDGLGKFPTPITGRPRETVSFHGRESRSSSMMSASEKETVPCRHSI